MPGPRRFFPSLTVTALVIVGAALLLIPRPEGPGSAEQASEQDAVPTVREGVLTVGWSPTPPFSLPGLEAPRGFDVDLAAELAQRLGLRPSLVDIDGDPFSRLVSGEVDLVVAGAPITEELEARVNLSDPYVRVRQALLVNVSVRPDLAAAEELTEGDDVAVIQGSTGQAWAATHLEPGAIEVVPYDDAEEAAVALAAGSVDALLADEVSAIAGIASRESLRIVETFPTGEGLGVAVDPRNPRLLGAVNAALMAVAADGTYDLLYDRYRDTLPPGGRITRA